MTSQLPLGGSPRRALALTSGNEHVVFEKMFGGKDTVEAVMLVLAGRGTGNRWFNCPEGATRRSPRGSETEAGPEKWDCTTLTHRRRLGPQGPQQQEEQVEPPNAAEGPPPMAKRSPDHARLPALARTAVRSGDSYHEQISPSGTNAGCAGDGGQGATPCSAQSNPPSPSLLHGPRLARNCMRTVCAGETGCQWF